MFETTDSAAATIVKRCDEVMERHPRVEIEGFAHCNYCGLEGIWPSDAYASARDLLDAIEDAGREMLESADDPSRSPYAQAAYGISACLLDEAIASAAQEGENEGR